VKLAPSAFLASAASCDSLSNRILRSKSPISAADTQAIEKWSEFSGETNLPSEPGNQKAWTCKSDDKTLNDLLANCTDSERAIFNAYNDKTAAAGLKALPCQNLGFKLNNPQVRIAVAHRLGSVVCRPHTCVCGANVTKLGIHGLSCRNSAGRFARHSMINTIIKRTFVSCGIPAQLEPPGLCRADGKRVDGVTMVTSEKGHCLTWDVTGVDALAPSHIRNTANEGTASPTADSAETKNTQNFRELIDTD
jgi:hypothetical protein